MADTKVGPLNHGLFTQKPWETNERNHEGNHEGNDEENMGTPLEIHWKTMGKPLENPWKTVGKNRQNQG